MFAEVSKNTQFRLISLTFEAIDAAQVHVCHVRDVGQVICQSELAAVNEIDSASIGADIANHADNTACKGAWTTIKGRSWNEVRVNNIPRTS